MRTRTIVAGMTLALAFTAAGGCQIIAQLNTLQVGTGGGPGADGGAPCQPQAPCGGTCMGSTLTPSGICGADGTCPSVPQACPSDFACADETKCNTSCGPNADCAAGHICYPQGIGGGSGSQCMACGDTPKAMCTQGPSLCTGTCDPSSPGTCDTTCDGGCAGTFTLNAVTFAAKLTCDASCASSTIKCMGLFPCEIDCPSLGTGMGTPSCHGTTVQCDDGPCTVVCTGTGCADVVQQCGPNSCKAVYMTPPNGMNPPVQQNCNQSCSCVPDAGT